MFKIEHPVIYLIIEVTIFVILFWGFITGLGGHARAYFTAIWGVARVIFLVWPQLIGATLGYVVAKFYPEKVAEFWTISVIIGIVWFVLYIFFQLMRLGGVYMRYTGNVLNYGWGIVLMVLVTAWVTLTMVTLSASYQ